MKQILYTLILISYPIYCSEKIIGKHKEIPISKLEEHLEIKIHTLPIPMMSSRKLLAKADLCVADGMV